MAILSTTAQLANAQSATDWAGWYAGGQIGGLLGDADWDFNNGNYVSNEPSGIFAGAHVGYNWAPGSWVYGVELEYNISNSHGSTSCPYNAYNCETDIKSIGELKGKLGKPVASGLVYGLLGVAMADVNHATPLVATGVPAGTDSQTFTGWAVGLGYAAKIGDNGWSWRAELAHNDLGSKTSPAALSGPPSTVVDLSYQTLSLGVSKRF